MRLVPMMLGMLVLFAGGVSPAEIAAPRIKKILPHYLDLEGRHTTAPSLYERDAYQEYLRKHPQEQSGLRFDIHCHAGDYPILILRVEMRGSAHDKTTRATISKPLVRRNRWSQWSAVAITGDEFSALGKLVAWRASLWDGDTLVAEQRSFLWSGDR